MKRNATGFLGLYAVFTALALLFGYVESLFSLSFIAPGMKLGVANTVVLYLICRQKPISAFAVNTARIFLSALLFVGGASLLFSFPAGLVSVAGMWLASKSRRIGVVGVSGVGALLHNATQICIAWAVVGPGVWYYFPFLLVAGTAAGSVIGVLTFWLWHRTKNVPLPE